MADLVQYELDDGTSVLFEAAEADLVSLRGAGSFRTEDGGALSDRLAGVARTAGQVAESMRAAMSPDELSVELGVKVAGELNAWFFARNQAEATIKVTATWKNKPATGQPAAGR
ncbi:CU044_2847 family protein [Actinoplanes sp. NPDC051343]|uniref:CU044_2847 family protein n=1 Tax=Actinoplanes sp. NPDC051343 TaxID=3363906 RepID=UPI0037B19891